MPKLACAESYDVSQGTPFTRCERVKLSEGDNLYRGNKYELFWRGTIRIGEDVDPGAKVTEDLITKVMDLGADFPFYVYLKFSRMGGVKDHGYTDWYIENCTIQFVVIRNPLPVIAILSALVALGWITVLTLVVVFFLKPLVETPWMFLIFFAAIIVVAIAYIYFKKPKKDH